MVVMEIKKLFTFKSVLILIAALFVNLILVNFGVQNTYTNDYLGASPAAYRQIFSDMSDMSEEQKLDFLVTLSEKARAESVRSEIASCEQNGNLEEADFQREEYAELLKKYPDEYTPLYLPTLQQEVYFLNELASEAQTLFQYDEFLVQTVEEAQQKTKISIFAEPDTFAYRNLQKIAEDYNKMKGTTPVFDISDGVKTATEAVVTDWIAILLLLFISGELIIREKERGMLPVIKTAKNGRIPVISSKVMVIALGAVILTFLFFGENLIYGSCVFGMGDLSRPIQSLAGYRTCTLSLTVGQYLICLFLVKVMAYFLMGMFSLFMCIIFFQPVPVYSCVAVILAVSYTLYGVIQPISKWNLFRYINIACFLSGTTLFQGEQNLNILGKPIGTLSMAFVVILVLIILLVGLNLWLFSHRKTTDFPFRMLALKKKKKRITFGKSVSVQYHEFFKLFVTNKALLLIGLFIVFQIYTPKDYVYFSQEQLFQKNYMETLSGEVTEEKEEFIQKETQRFAQIQEEMDALMLKYENGELSGENMEVLYNAYRQKMAPQSVFENEIVPLYEHLKQKQIDGEKAYFIYDGGYRTLFAQEEYDTGEQDIERGTMLLLLLILCCCGLFPMEYVSGMNAILQASKNGRKKTVFCKLAATIVVGVILFVGVYLPDILFAAENYGLDYVNAPLNNLIMFADWGNGWRIWQYMLLLYLLRLATMFILIFLIAFISLKMKRTLPTIFASMILLLPFIFHILGIQWIDRISFIPLLAGNQLLQGNIGWTVFYVVVAVCMGITAVAVVINNKKL